MRIGTRDRGRRRTLLGWLQAHADAAAALFFVLVVAAAGQPILKHLNTVVVGDDIDVYINLWADWWTLQAWREGAISLWHSDYLFYPVGADLTFHSFSHLNTATSLALRPFFGAVGAYNLTILANYVLIGLSMFQLARAWTGSTASGLLAGIVFAFNSHALYQSCHPVLLSIWVLPWATLYLGRALGVVQGPGEAGNRRSWLMAGLFVFLAALVSVLMLIILALWLVLFVAGVWLARARQAGGAMAWLRAHWRELATFGLGGGVAALAVVWPVAWEGLVAGDGSYLVDPADSLVTDLASLVTPHWVDWYVRGIYLGAVPAALALLALGKRRLPGGRASWPWLALFAGALLVAIGPLPVLAHRALDVTLPWSIVPARLLRNTYRFNILVSLGWAMLAALGWPVLRSQLPRSRMARGAVAALLALLILLEYLLPGIPYTRLSAPRFYSQTLAQMPAETVVAIVPTGRQVDKVHLYYQTLHGKRMTNGVISREEAGTQAFVRGNALLRAGHYDLPPAPLPANPQRALRDLARAGVDLLVVEKGWQHVDVAAWRQTLGEERIVYEDGRVVVWGGWGLEIGDWRLVDWRLATGDW